jgi:nucleoid-associated protein YgaU
MESSLKSRFSLLHGPAQIVLTLSLIISSGCSGTKKSYSLENDSGIVEADTIEITPIDSGQRSSVQLTDDQAVSESLAVDSAPPVSLDGDGFVAATQEQAGTTSAVANVTETATPILPMETPTDSLTAVSEPVSIDSSANDNNNVAQSTVYSIDSAGSADASVASPVSVSTEVAGDGTYTVQPGDTLMRIAFNVYGNVFRWKKIFDLNQDKLTDANVLKSGMVLKTGMSKAVVKATNGEPYLVKKGDTLGSIAQDVYAKRQYWKRLYENNKHIIKNPNQIYAGFYIYYQISEEERQEAQRLRAQAQHQSPNYRPVKAYAGRSSRPTNMREPNRNIATSVSDRALQPKRPDFNGGGLTSMIEGGYVKPMNPVNTRNLSPREASVAVKIKTPDRLPAANPKKPTVKSGLDLLR